VFFVWVKGAFVAEGPRALHVWSCGWSAGSVSGGGGADAGKVAPQTINGTHRGES